MLSKAGMVPSLEARLVVIRRRRRHRNLKQLAMASPVVIGSSLVLLAAFGGIAGFR
ncbi:MAG TPA: hypothetical protein VIO85_04870 [Candidatus Dormibacteraeota bacterium]